MNHALEIMKRDRKWNDDGGRKVDRTFSKSSHVAQLAIGMCSVLDF